MIDGGLLKIVDADSSSIDIESGGTCNEAYALPWDVANRNSAIISDGGVVRSGNIVFVERLEWYKVWWFMVDKLGLDF